MTLANKITITRILLVPLFVLQMIYYILPFQQGSLGKEWHRWLAIALFVVASISDGVDGYIARRYNQKSRLGTILDPLADKVLLVSALILLSLDTKGAFQQLPMWFPVLIISRELILVVGAFVIHMMGVTVVVRPRVVGKIATFFQMVTLGWIFLKIPSPHLFWFAAIEQEVTLFHVPLVLAGLCTLISGLWYIVDGSRQLTAHQISH
jgi:CDP-diacylglycerol--glycerol-3-phosphate 3-phosphatidyltransferase